MADLCCRCDRPTDNIDPESGHRVHDYCLQVWWDLCGPLPAPIRISIAGGGYRIVGGGIVTSTPDDDDPAALRARGVLT